MKFTKAEKTQSRARIALCGPSGSGKTYTALLLAKGLGDRVALIDTERGSASKYAGDVADFDKLELESFSPELYVEAIRAADNAGYDVIVIDSLSHAWSGKGGALELVDAAAARGKGNSFAAWRGVTPMQQAMVDAMLQAKAHVIATMRTKTEYVLEEGPGGKKVPRKIGMAPIQRDGIEYEFDVVGDLDHDHRLVITKSRCSALSDAVITKPGADVARTIREWLSTGAAPAAKESPVAGIVALLESAGTLEDLAAARDKAREMIKCLRAHERDAAIAALTAARDTAAARIEHKGATEE